ALAKLASDPAKQSGIASLKMAVVTGIEAKDIHLGFADGSSGVLPYDGYKWARPELKNQTWGAVPTGPAQVAKPGDVLYVEPEGKPGQFGLRQIPEVNGAIVAMDPHT